MVVRVANFRRFEAVFVECKEEKEEYEEVRKAIVPIILDLDEVVYWYPDINDDFEAGDDDTIVVFKSGYSRCLHVSFNDFTIVKLGVVLDEQD